MLEVKWKAVAVLLTLVPLKGFNPCYVGSKMERGTVLALAAQEASFNPCYVGSKMESQGTSQRDARDA